MPFELTTALRSHQGAFDIALETEKLDALGDYHDLVQKRNPLLHLVAPCSVEEFAVRHILESLTLLKHLPGRAKFVDVGAGAGLPSIPCLIVRNDINATLIESKEKKARFLNEALAQLELSGRAEVVNRQFQETTTGDASFITCRALDRFQEKLPKLLKWGMGRTFLLFGGPSIAESLSASKREFEAILMPMSKQRYLYLVVPNT